MSHQVIISFDVDEEKIAENAAKEAGRQVARDVLMEAFGANYARHDLMRRYVYNTVREIIELDKEEIIQEVIHELVDSMRRTKLVKESLAKAMEEFNHEGNSESDEGNCGS